MATFAGCSLDEPPTPESIQTGQQLISSHQPINIRVLIDFNLYRHSIFPHSDWLCTSLVQPMPHPLPLPLNNNLLFGVPHCLLAALMLECGVHHQRLRFADADKHDLWQWISRVHTARQPQDEPPVEELQAVSRPSEDFVAEMRRMLRMSDRIDPNRLHLLLCSHFPEHLPRRKLQLPSADHSLAVTSTLGLPTPVVRLPHSIWLESVLGIALHRLRCQFSRFCPELALQLLRFPSSCTVGTCQPRHAAAPADDWWSQCLSALDQLDTQLLVSTLQQDLHHWLEQPDLRFDAKPSRSLQRAVALAQVLATRTVVDCDPWPVFDAAVLVSSMCSNCPQPQSLLVLV